MRIQFNEEIDDGTARKGARKWGRLSQQLYPENALNLRPGRAEEVPECTCGKPYQPSGRLKKGPHKGRMQYNKKHTPECPAGIFWAQRRRPHTAQAERSEGTEE